MTDRRSTVARTSRALAAFLTAFLFATLALAGTPWTGSGSSNLAPSNFTSTTDGIGQPVFTYSTGLDPYTDPATGATVYPTPTGNGSWQFQTTSVTTGPIAVEYRWTGFHAFFNVRAQLVAFVTSASGTTTSTLVDAGPANCCSAPSAGFDYSGQFVFNVNAGDTYGFTIAGSNSDADGRLIGTLTVGLPQPVLLQAYEVTGGAYLIGLASGLPGTAVTVQTYTSPVCIDGQLGAGGTAVGSPLPVTTDPAGYFGLQVPNVPLGDFVAVEIVSPAPSAMTACVVSTGNNDYWPKALDLGSSTQVRDYIDTAGKARWYKLKMMPGQRLSVTLSGLPADYDLAVFRDIAAAFQAQLVPANASDLTKLSAEFAPSVFSPSVFSPSVFSPSVFSPSVFSPSVFSQTDVAQAFSSAQTRSIVGVSATPGTGNELVVVNSWNTSEDYYIRVSGRGGAFSTAGQFTVNVEKSGVSCTAVIDTTLSPRASVGGQGLKTLILTDSTRIDLASALAAGGTLRSKLDAFASRPEIGGKIIDLKDDARVQVLKQQAASNAACPYATNLVAEEVKGIVDAHRANNPGLRYVVIVGNDSVVPFFRYPDQSLLGQESGYFPPMRSTSVSEASLRNDYVLSQDAYGAGKQITLRTAAFPVPGLAVGRLVETPSEIAGLIDAYVIAGGTVVPRTSLVTGYDFLADAATAVKAEIDLGTGVPGDTLIAPNNISPQDPAAWTAAQLRVKLLGNARNDLVFLGGHFSANSALAADFATQLVTTDLAGASTDFTNVIVMSAGCHAGYNIVDSEIVNNVTLPLDWAQAFAQKKATLIAGTGYQYGDTDFLEYSERLYTNVAKQLRAGSGAVAIGEALVKAKLDYLATTPDIRGIHEKALLEATLFGLPMLAVNMPGQRTGTSGAGGAITPALVAAGPGRDLDLRTYDFALDPVATVSTQALSNVQDSTTLLATWLTGPNGVVTNPAEPALPLTVVDVTPTDSAIVLRGVGFRGGTYVDSTVVPLTGAPTTDLRGVHVPFVSPVFYPMRPWTINYFGALGGNGKTSLLLTPAQHRALDVGAGTSVQRRFNHLDLRFFYSGNYSKAALSDAPTIVSIDAKNAGGGIDFTAQVVGDPAAGVVQVWIVYTAGNGAWTPLDLAQCVDPLPAQCGSKADSRLWKARLGSAPAGLQFVVQAASGTGLVSLDDNRGAYYGIGGSFETSQTAAAATTLALTGVPSTAKFGDTLPVALNLSSGGNPLAGNPVTISVGGTSRTATTDANGNASANVPITVVPGNYSVVATFAGNASYKAATASTSLQVGVAPTSLAALAAPAIGVKLTASQGSASLPLLQEAVTFTLNGPGGLRTLVVATNYLGEAIVPTSGLPGGTYTAQASYGGNATYGASSLALASFVVQGPQSINVPFVTSPASLVYAPGATFSVTATATSGLPVTLASQSPAICTTGGVNGATVTMVAPGMCSLLATQAGNAAFFAAVPVTQVITIGKGNQSINFAGPGNQTLGTPPITLTATATSGLAVAFSAAGGCSVSGTTLTLTSTGTCTITASQAGNTLWNAAAEVARTIAIDVANAWTPIAAKMTTPRAHHTATRFESGPLAGWVLVAGGVDSDGRALSSAELYNPATRTFVATDKLHGKSTDHTATLLADGRVMVVGGGNASADFFDPVTKTWSAMGGGAGTNRSMHTATRLPDGRVLIVGGAGNNGKTLATTVVFNPAGGGSFVNGPTMDTARERHTATLLTSGPNAGKVLIVGGRFTSGNGYTVPATYQLCDATACTPSKTGITARFKHAAALVTAADGTQKVLVAGGKNPSGLLATAEAYDLSTNTWTNSGLGTLTPARKGLSMTALPNGHALVAGGRGKASPGAAAYPMTSVDLFGPPLASGAQMTRARSWHTATPLIDAGGRVTGVLVIGGKTGTKTCDDDDEDENGVDSTDTAEIYGR